MASHIVLQVAESGTREKKRKDHEVKDLKKQYTLPDLKIHHPWAPHVANYEKATTNGEVLLYGQGKNLLP